MNDSIDAQNSPKAVAHDLHKLEKGQPEEETWKPGKQEWLVMITMAVSSLVVALDATILVPVLPTLAVELNGSTTDTFWAGTSYLLTHAVVQPFIAALSDIFGRRELLFPSILLFTIGSIICGVSHNFPILLVGRVVQGVGGGGIMTLAQIIFADIIPLRQRPKYFATVLLAWALGTLLGPLTGGLLVEHGTWRWCFYLNLPICGIALLLTILFVNLTTEHVSLHTKLSRVDWLGGFLFISSLTSFLIAISWGGTQHPWSSCATLVPILLGAVGLVITFLYEHRLARYPFLPSTLFHNSTSSITYTIALLQGLAFYMTLYYITFFFTSVQFDSALTSAVNLFPATAFVLPAAILISQLITRTGSYRWAIWGGWAISTLGAGLLIRFDQHTKTPVWAATLAVLGFGLGMTLSSTTFAVQAAVGKTEDAGKAAAMYAFMRALGMTVGVAMGGTIFQNVMSRILVEVGLSEVIARNAEAFVDATLRGLAVGDPVREGALAAYVAGFRGVWIALTGTSAGALVVSALIKGYCLDQSLESRYSLQMK